MGSCPVLTGLGPWGTIQLLLAKASLVSSQIEAFLFISAVKELQVLDTVVCFVALFPVCLASGRMPLPLHSFIDSKIFCSDVYSYKFGSSCFLSHHRVTKYSMILSCNAKELGEFSLEQSNVSAQSQPRLHETQLTLWGTARKNHLLESKHKASFVTAILFQFSAFVLIAAAIGSLPQRLWSCVEGLAFSRVRTGCYSYRTYMWQCDML